MRIHKIGCVVAAAVVLAVGTAACGGDSVSGQTQEIGGEAKVEGASAGPDQEITVGAAAEPAGLDPQKEQDEGMEVLLNRVYEPLYDSDVDGETVPQLADGLPKRIDDRTWEVRLKKGVKFSDGTPFTADAVVYSLDRITNPDFGSTFTQVGGIRKTEKVDDHTVRITTKQPDPLLPSSLKVARILAPNGARAPGFPQKTNGTGPYTLASSDASKAVLKYNPAYRGEEPQVTTVNVRFMPDPNTRIQALEAGEVDLLPSVPPGTADRLPKVAATAGPISVGIVRMNTYKPPLDDLRVRQAINYAVDKEAIAKSLYGGFASPVQCQPTLPSASNFNESLEPVPYDLEKAKRLVEEAGAVGRELNMSWSTGVFPQDRAVGEAVTDAINQTGLKVNTKFNEYLTWQDDVFTSGPKAPDMVWLETDDPIGDVTAQLSYFYTTDGAVSTFDGAKNGMNDLFANASSEMDPAKRGELFGELAKQGCEEAPLLFLDYRKDIIAMAEHLGYRPYAQPAVRLVYDEIEVGERG